MRIRSASRRVRPLFLAALLLSFTIWSGPPSALEAATRPNIVIIVADDLGYADLGCHGCKDIPTPHIDSLARGGIRCTSGYVSCPVCSPARAGLLTGRYQQRFGHEFNPGAEGGLPVSEVTLPERLKAAGYRTGLVGKWHLGLGDKFHPLRRGFDDFFGFLSGAHSYKEAKAKAKNPVLRGTEPVDEKEYLTDAFTREAVAFIERHRNEPFFLLLAYNAVHVPMHATQKYLDRFSSIPEGKRRTYAAMVAALDDGVGAVLGKLRKAEIEDNTLIVFLSDNGGPTRGNASCNEPLAGVKSQVLEGGIRVPFLVQWKGRLPQGKVYDHPVIALDLFPTAIASAGGKLPNDRPLDGINLLPYLGGKLETPPHTALFWRYGESAAVRRGEWKLVTRGPDPGLFNLAADIGETTDLAAQKPQIVKDLEKAFKEWSAQLAEPLWGKQAGGSKGKR